MNVIDKNRNKSGLSFLAAGIMLLSFSLTLYSCATDTRQLEDCPNESCLLTTEDAIAIFDYSFDKALNERVRHSFSRYFLEQEILSVDWSKANRFYAPLYGNDNVEAPFQSRYFLQFYMRDRSGRSRLLETYQRILIVSDRRSGAEGAFVMTMVADRNYSKAKNSKDLGNFHNNGDYTGFSGLVIFSRLSGTVVRVDRYLSGEQVDAVSMMNIKNGKDLKERTVALTRTFGGIMARRVYSYIDSRCRYDTDSDGYSLSSGENNGFWNNDTTPIPLDSAGYCWGDTSSCCDPDDIFGSGASWEYDWLPDGYWDNDPDPAPRGGGGGGGANAGRGNSGGETFSCNLAVGDKTVTVHFSPRLSTAAKESLKEKLKALAEDNHFKEIVRSIDWTRARVEALPNTSFESYQSGKTKSRGTYSADGSFKYSVEIWLNPDGDYYGYLEEFFHAEQFLSAKQRRY